MNDKSFKIMAWFLQSNRRKEMAQYDTLEHAIDGCEYQSAKLRDCSDFFTVRAGNEWLCCATRIGESVVYSIVE